MSDFNKWLINTRAFVTKNDNDSKFTHLLLNGGKLYIENINIFYEKYANCIKNEEYIYIVECRPDIFPLFFDLDFLLKSKDDLNDNIIIDIIKNINDVIKLFYNCYYKCIITTADDKVVIKNDNTYIKSGYHLHWEDVIVNKTIALDIRKLCIVKLKTLFGSCFVNNFNDIIDEHVFNSSGLRLTGSRKGHYVSQTKKFEDEGRPYNLYKVFNDKNEIDLDEYNILKNDYLRLVKQTSIISDNKNINDRTYDSKKYIEECEECEDSDDNKEYSPGSWNRLDKSSLQYTEIYRFFKNYVKDYSVNDIKRIFYSENGSVYIIWTKSKHCLNINREHNSCGIYFKLNKDGICQKCFCKCDTMEGRKYGYCRDFSSTLIPCTPHLKKLLNFKDEKKNNIFNNMVCDNEDDFRLNLYNSFTNKTPIRTKNNKKNKEELNKSS